MQIRDITYLQLLSTLIKDDLELTESYYKNKELHKEIIRTSYYVQNKSLNYEIQLKIWRYLGYQTEQIETLINKCRQTRNLVCLVVSDHHHFKNVDLRFKVMYKKLSFDTMGEF